MQKTKRYCKKCGDWKHMVRIIDTLYNYTDERHRVCFKCEENLQPEYVDEVSDSDEAFTDDKN